MIFDFRSAKAASLVFLGGITLIFFLITSPGCTSTSHNPPSIEIHTWAADTKTQSLIRNQDGKSMKCSDVLFDDMVCMHYEDLQMIQRTLFECKEW